MSELDTQLQALVANAVDSEPAPARDPVNQPMIRHWCDAIGDANPVYTDPEAAAASRHGAIIAPPTMLQAWSMPGLGRRRPFTGGPDPLALLDAAGYTSVVATDCEQDYKRSPKLGDHVSVTSRLESISSEKRTALGVGYFVTNLLTYRDQHGEIVAEMRFRILKFRPPAASVA